MSASLEKIAGLLALAERTDNVHEADAFLAKAQQIATLTSVDLAVARARADRREARSRPVSRTITIGEPGKRANKHLVSLFLAVARSNDVLADIARNSTYVVAYGMATDIDVTEALWGSVAHQMVAAAGAYLRVGDWRTQSYVAEVRQRRGGRVLRIPEQRPHTAQTARSTFYRAYIERVSQRLMQAREEALKEAAGTGERATSTSEPDRTAMVLMAKSEEIKKFHAGTSQARGAWRGYSGAVAADFGRVSSAGREAGSRARLTSQDGLSGPGRPLTEGRH